MARPRLTKSRKTITHFLQTEGDAGRLKKKESKARPSLSFLSRNLMSRPKRRRMWKPTVHKTFQKGHGGDTKKDSGLYLGGTVAVNCGVLIKKGKAKKIAVPTKRDSTKRRKRAKVRWVEITNSLYETFDRCTSGVTATEHQRGRGETSHNPWGCSFP